jgi:GTP-binding protein Era
MAPNLGEHRRLRFAGRPPNVGKSTLVNRILGRELSIVTPKPQTTRNRITAIYTMANAQMVLHDTPGIHKASTPLNRSLVAAAMKTLEEADVVLLITTPSEEIARDDLRIMDLIKSVGPHPCSPSTRPTIQPPAITLIDLFKTHSFKDCYISAFTARCSIWLTSLGLLPWVPVVPEDDVSDMPVRFFVEEIIRDRSSTKRGRRSRTRPR